jgi:hypothetical protein
MKAVADDRVAQDQASIGKLSHRDASVTMPWFFSDEATPFTERLLCGCARWQDGPGSSVSEKAVGFRQVHRLHWPGTAPRDA